MAEDKKEKKTEEIEVIASVEKPAKTEKYKVKKAFTLDKPYKKGQFIELSEGKIKETLISNKFI